jgi:hypothetical protein
MKEGKERDWEDTTNETFYCICMYNILKKPSTPGEKAHN